MLKHDSALIGCAVWHQTERSQAAIHIAVVLLAIAGTDAVQLFLIVQVIHHECIAAEPDAELLKLGFVVIQAIVSPMFLIHIPRVVEILALWAA